MEVCAPSRRLSRVYRHLFVGCTTEISSSDIVQSLLQVHTQREAVLLQLSTVRRLFSEAGQCWLEQQTEKKGQRLRDDMCQMLAASHSFVTNLVGHFKDSDQLVLFSSTKALCAVFLHPWIHIKLEWLEEILTTISPDADATSHLASTYRLQLFSELLKLIRKRLSVLSCERQFPSNRGSYVDKQNICFLVLERHWSRILSEFTAYLSNSKCLSPHPDLRSLESSLGEFLSLTVEMMKHNNYCLTSGKLVTEDKDMATECTLGVISSFSGEKWRHMDAPSGTIKPDFRSASVEQSEPGDQLKTCISSCQHMVVSHLPTLVPLLKASTSVFLLKKLLDVFLKAVDGECFPVGHVIEKLHLSIEQVLQTCVMRDAVGAWMQGCGLSQVSSILCKMEGALPIAGKESLAPVRQQDCGLLNTTARKLLVLLLKCAAVQVHLQSWPWNDALYSDLAQLVQASLSPAPCQGRTVVLVRNVAFQLLSEQDDCIMEVLLACCRIHQGLREMIGANPETRDWYCKLFDVHWAFVEFLSSVTFDHSVLLDLLMSPETIFPEFFQEYLRMVVTTKSEWEGLKLACAQYGLAPQEEGGGANFGDTLSVSEHSRSPVGGAAMHNQNSTVLPELLPFHADREPEAKRAKMEMSPQPDLEDATEEPNLLPWLPSNRKSWEACEEPSPCETAEQSEADSSSASEQELEASRYTTPIPQKPCLDRVLGCCIRLKYTLERLLDKTLLPNPTVGEGIVPLLEDLEDLYESD